MDQATRELLTAYLDGELPDEEAAAIDRRLASDEALRKQVQEFDRVWNALDGLPRPEVSEAFAQTTIEMVAIEAKEEVAAKTAILPQVKRRRGWGVAGASVAALVLGFLLVRGATMKPERQLLTHLPVIYRVDALQEVDGPEFLRSLTGVAPALLEQADPDRVAKDVAIWSRIADGDSADRAEWVASLDEGDKATLQDAARRYQRGMTPKRRDAAQAVYTSIASAEDRDQLMQTALAYEAWLASQPASDRSRLGIMPVEERLAELRRIDRKTVVREARTLSPEDLAALRKATASLKGGPELTAVRNAILKGFEEVANLRQRFAGSERAPEVEQIMLERLDRVFASPTLAVLAISRAADGPPVRGGMPDLPGRASPQAIGMKMRRTAADAWGRIERKLLASLSQSGRDKLMRLDPDQRRRRLADFALQAAKDKTTKIDLEEFFASDALTDDDRHRLLALPSAEMTERLEKLYAERVAGGGDEDLREIPEWLRAFGGGFRQGEGRRGGFGQRPGAPGRDSMQDSRRRRPRGPGDEGSPGRRPAGP
ncbi:MAG: zf-HC2 domain-containing protein [Planctomycetota bacterium]